MQKDFITKLSTQELKDLKSRIERELETRETVCIWSLKTKDEEKKTQEVWEGETYIS